MSRARAGQHASQRRCTNQDGQQDCESGADFEHGAHQLAHDNITVVLHSKLT